jgi:hypothetical protein
MITVNTCGGLGNQIFQYAFARALAVNHEVALLNSCTQYGIGLGYLNITIPVLPHPGWRWIAERSLRYDPNPEIEENSILAGYWQCENYFRHISDVLKAELTLKEAPSASAQQFSEQIDNTPNSVLLHIRRGDYLTWAAARHGVLPLDYYLHAASLLANHKFFLFSDDPDVQCPLPHTRVRCLPHEELWLMSRCKNAIIANSSFSWWGAWLGADKTGTVIAPKQWFRTGNEDARDIVPERWLRI